LKNSISNQDFKQLLFNTKSLPIRDLLFYYKKSANHGVSFIVGKHRGGAVTRNLFKRRCRALFIEHQNDLFQNTQIIIKPTKNLQNNYDWKELRLSFQLFCRKLQA
tara:strand:+ start:6988 stop:7305 length:318 start_codon:yes stop_codon:yes gene_type:complete